ncbi:MAG: hypothetical protein F6K08_34885 [Okeania sp. SIO1H6]|nr:hypothetical protein [Okeania sp. SIO1H6]
MMFWCATQPKACMDILWNVPTVAYPNENCCQSEFTQEQKSLLIINSFKFG